MTTRIAALLCTLLALLAAGADTVPPADGPRIKVEAAATEPQSTDNEDAKDYPRVLPRSGQARGWTKTQPVRVARDTAVKTLIADDRLAEIVSLYPVKLAARCTYTNKGTRAEVTLIEAASPDDAFGILSVYSAEPPTGPEGDGSFRSITQRGSVLRASACQGVYFATIRADRPSAEPDRPAVEALLARILFSAPYAEPPLLLRIIPREKLPDCRIWLVRHTEALKLIARHGAASEWARRAWAEMDTVEKDKRLGLDGGPLLSVAAVRTGGATDIIWIVEYPTASDAEAAYDRYAAGAKNAPTALDADTALAQPFDRFLLGSWSAEQEKAQHLLPLLRTFLPEPVPPAPAPATAPAAATKPAATTGPAASETE